MSIQSSLPKTFQSFNDLSRNKLCCFLHDSRYHSFCICQPVRFVCFCSGGCGPVGCGCIPAGSREVARELGEGPVGCSSGKPPALPFWHTIMGKGPDLRTVAVGEEGPSGGTCMYTALPDGHKMLELFFLLLLC